MHTQTHRRFDCVVKRRRWEFARAITREKDVIVVVGVIEADTEAGELIDRRIVGFTLEPNQPEVGFAIQDFHLGVGFSNDHQTLEFPGVIVRGFEYAALQGDSFIHQEVGHQSARVGMRSHVTWEWDRRVVNKDPSQKLPRLIVSGFIRVKIALWAQLADGDGKIVGHR